MRVISGSAKGRKLKSPKTDDTRPILDRVKTALFDILNGDVVDADLLDLFAGTGGIGIEALSRGAASATFVELNAEVYRLIQENLELTRLTEHATVIRGDAFRFLDYSANKGRTWDMIYIAPPQYQGLAARALAVVDAAALLRAEGQAIVQMHPNERRDLDGLTLTSLELVDERKYGSTLLLFYMPREAADAPPPAVVAHDVPEGSLATAAAAEQAAEQPTEQTTARTTEGTGNA